MKISKSGPINPLNLIPTGPYHLYVTEALSYEYWGQVPLSIIVVLSFACSSTRMKNHIVGDTVEFLLSQQEHFIAPETLSLVHQNLKLWAQEAPVPQEGHWEWWRMKSPLFPPLGPWTLFICCKTNIILQLLVKMCIKFWRISLQIHRVHT